MNLNPIRHLRSGIVQNVIALYGVQACTYAIPVLTIPYLARVLGPSGWGSLVFAQSIGFVISIFVEYGFDFSASRETSCHRNDPHRLSELISGVIGAKVLLATLCVCAAVFSRRFTHHIAPSLALFWASTIWGVCQGINMFWFFQGLERMRLAGTLEVVGKVVAGLSMFVLVRKPEDGWKYMAAQCVGCVVAHGVTIVMAYREVGFSWPGPSSALRALRLGWSMFLFRAIDGLRGSINGLVLGYVAPLAALGEYAGADRITRVFQQGLWPINQALFPRLTHQTKVDPKNAMRTVRFSLLFLGGLGSAFGLALFLGAPWLVHVILGRAFHESVPVLRVLSLWIPLVALTTVMIFQLLLPRQMDNRFNLVTLNAGLLSIGGALLLAPKFQAVGIAWSVVAAQLYTLIAFSVVLVRAGLNPFALSEGARAGGVEPAGARQEYLLSGYHPGETIATDAERPSARP